MMILMIVQNFWTLILQIFVIRMHDRLHYVKSNIKYETGAQKKGGDETLRQETLRKWTWWLSDCLVALR